MDKGRDSRGGLILFFCFLFGALLVGLSGEVYAQGAVLKDLTPVLSVDGLSATNVAAPLVMVADPDPNVQGIKVEGPSAAQALAEPNAAAATFSITYVPAGQGDLWYPNNGGALCQDFPVAAKTAFQAAAAIWASQFQSPVPITIRACWASLASPSTLGYSGGGTSHRDFSGAPQAGTWYSAALANSLAGSDLDPNNYDMHITYNSNFSWYYGTDGNPPYNQHDLVTVAAHEIAHGLNFAGTATVSGGVGSWGNGTGYPNIYDRYMRDVNGVSLLSTSYPNNSTALGTLLTSSNLWWRGANAMAANGGQPVKMYAPASWAPGSSYSHLDYTTFGGTANSMMVYAIGAGSSNHNPGPVTVGLLKDLGWQAISAACSAPSSIVVPAADADGVYTVSWGASVTAGVTYELQEATNSAFTAGLRTAYNGAALSTTITGRSQNVTYFYRVRALKTGLTASAWRVAANGCPVPGTVTAGVPASITVPVADGDGVYAVSWGASATAGVTYELQEATNSTFTAGLRTAYSGTALSAAISGRSQNVTYYYRIRAIKGGLKNSAYRSAVNSCAVPGTSAAGVPASITVPVADADGVYAVSWGASATAGVTYELQEATSSNFSTGLRVAFSGTATSAGISGRSQNVTYYYRVRAVKGGLKDSGYRSSVNGCAVPGSSAAGIPASITVPVADADGVYAVSWGASATAGVTYELQEAINSLFTIGLRTAYRGAALSAAITGRSQNTTYYYRVRAVKPGLKDSAYRTGSNGCPVPGASTVVTPASITVPASDSDGSFAINWGASTTAGVTYELQEATNNTFSAGLRTAYSGTALSCSITGRVSGATYWYRVKAIKAGMKDSAYRTGSNGCVVTISNTLANALDTAYGISTGGNANWRYQTAVSYYGGDAAQSGLISHSQSSWMQTTVTGPGFVSFYWKVSSESGFDYLKFYIDGVEQPGKISGEVAWTQRSFVVADGSHVVKWEYAKDSSASYGSDAGWVDKFVFTPGANETLVGTWTLNFTWTGYSPGSTSLVLTSNNRFTTGDGYAGSWVYNGTTFWLYFDTGTTYTSTGAVTSTHMAGTMIDYNGNPGTWAADKQQLAAIVTGDAQSSPASTKTSSGEIR